MAYRNTFDHEPQRTSDSNLTGHSRTGDLATFVIEASTYCDLHTVSKLQTQPSASPDIGI